MSLQSNSNPRLNSYLSELAQSDGTLFRLLRNPDPKNGLAHTPREIVQQPFLWRETARMMKEIAAELRSFLAGAGLFDDSHPPEIVFTGAGTSDYVGLSVIDLLRRRLSTTCSNWPSTRLAADPNSFFLTSRRLIQFHIARSGNSPESVAVLKMALRHYPDQIRHVVITCNREGALAECAMAHQDKVFLILLDEASNDRGLAMTSSFSNMVLAGQAVAYLSEMEAFVDIVDRVAGAGEHLLERYADTVYELAEPTLTRAFFLGNGDLLGAAVESALKVQELTVGQMMAKGEDPLGFRHGPISAVDEHSKVSFYLSADDHTRRYELDVLLQYDTAFERLGAKTVVLCAEEPGDNVHSSVHLLTYDPDGEWQVPVRFQVNVAVLFGQMFGLFASQRRSLNVDEPSVDKALYNRTVEGVRIYENT